MKNLAYSELTKRLYFIGNPKIDITDDVKEYIDFISKSVEDTELLRDKINQAIRDNYGWGADRITNEIMKLILNRNPNQ